MKLYLTQIYKILNPTIKFIVGVFLLMFVVMQSISAATRTASQSGNWNSTVTWGGSAMPTSSDDVIVPPNVTVTVNVATATCNSLTFTAGKNGTLAVNSGMNLSVTSSLTLNNAPNSAVTAFIEGDGSLNCQSLYIGNSTAPNKDNTSRLHTLTSTINNFFISGNIYIDSYYATNNRIRNGVFLLNSGSITLNGSLITSNDNAANLSKFILGDSSPSLILNGVAPFDISTVGASTITLNGTGSTVNYSFSGTQTISGTLYNNLTISGSGTKTLGASTTVSGNFTLSDGTFVANNNTSYDLNILGDYIQTDGIFDFNAGTSGISNVYIGRNFFNSAGVESILTTGSGVNNGVFTFNGLGVQTMNMPTPGASVWVKYIIPVGKSVELLSNISLSSADLLTEAIFQGEMQVSGTLNVGDYTITQNSGAAGTAVFSLNSGAKLITSNVNGVSGSISSTNMTNTFSSAANYEFRGASTGTFTTTPTALTVKDLTINNPAGVALTTRLNVNGTLTLMSGQLSLGSKILRLNVNASAIAGTFDASNMIVTNGIGTLQKRFSAPGSFVFPVGDNTGTAEYSPITVNIASGTFATAYISVKLSNSKHPNASNTSYINRYWSVVQSGLTDFSASIEGTYVPADVVGASANIISARWITPNWVRYAAPVDNKIAANSLVAFGDFTGINNLPIITNSVTSLSGFTYLEGLGPSAQQSFTVSGTDLFTNITVNPSENFEVSTSSEPSFVATSPLNIPVIDGNIDPTTVYVRLKAGVSVGTVAAQNVTCASIGATTKNLTCSGTVTDAPLITPSVTSLVGFIYNSGGGPSIAQSFTVNGAYLSSDILLSAPTNYEISLSASSGYSTSLLLSPTAGNVSTLIYVRLKAGLLISSYVENITLTTTNGITKTVACNGAVNAPTINVSKFTLAGFIYTVGAGPSGEQTFNINGQNLTAPIVLTAPSNFKISLTSGTGFANSITLTPISQNVSSTTIYVRMNAGLLVSIVPPVNLTAISTGAITQTVALSGQVASTSTTISSSGTLNGFVYILGQGPSIEQTFTVSATSLTANVTVTPPSPNYEISLTSGSGFVTYPNTLSISQSGGTVNSVPVYVRLKAGLSVASYNSQNIVLSSPGATNVNVVCNGVVVTGPTIIAGPAGLDALCPGSNVTLTSTSTDITNQTWTGPNGFYSTAQNPVLGVVTATNNGTYTVTGSALSGVNLLTNGGFELGNTGFGSTYIYQQVAPPEKGNYWISANPKDMYESFCACTPHSGTKQMIVDGATTIGIVAWSETVAVTPGQDYQFSYWVQNVFSYPNVAQLQLYINGQPIGTSTNVPAYGTPWTQYIYNSNSGTNTVLQLTLINKSIEPNGNDFALDDFEFQQVFPVSASVELTVNSILAPSLTVTASNNPVTAGSEVVFTATPTNGGVSPTYQWYVDGLLKSGATNSTYAYVPANGEHVSCIMTSNYPCASPATATNEVIMEVTAINNYWRGTIDNNWSVLGNWTAGFVPAPGNDVVFATTANYGSDAIRDLHLDQDRTIGSLINATTKRLVIPAGKGLLVNNTISTDNNPDRIYIYSSSTIANGSLAFHNEFSSPVSATVEMYSKASWDLTQVINNKYRWQYFGIPLRSIVAYPSFTGAYVRKWYETGTTIQNHWLQLSNESVLQPFYGYEICQESPKTYVFKGQLVNDDFNSGQLAITTATALFPGQHIFANPYTAAIDIRELSFGSQTEATVYMYHTGTFSAWETGGQTSPGLAPGFYISVPQNLAGYVPNIPRQVPSMGTMLVKAKTLSSNATFGINYNSVIMNNTDLKRAPKTSDEFTSDKVSTIVELKSEKYEDKLWLITEDLCSKNFDNGWDGFKIVGSSLSPQLFAMEKDGNYQVNTVSDINDTDLGFQAGTDVEYTLNFEHQNLFSKYAGLYLLDLLENKTIDISANGAQYKFMAESTPKPIKRFKIITRYYEKEAADAETQIKVFSANKTVFIQNFSNLKGRVMLFDMTGQMIKNTDFDGSTISMVTNNLVPGAYIVKAQTNNEEVSKRIIVQ